MGFNPDQGMEVCPPFSVLCCLVKVDTLAMGRSSVQGVLPKCLNGFITSEVNCELEQARGPKPWNV
jgi:hypothetical protein